MHANSRRRRVHGAEFKVAVLEECRRPEASVAAVALAHGLNVNLVRKWLVGRGLKRLGPAAGRAPQVDGNSEATPPRLQFVPVELGSGDGAGGDGGAVRPQPLRSAPECADIQIELRRGAARLTVRWPASLAEPCVAWLRELAAAAMK